MNKAPGRSVLGCALLLAAAGTAQAGGLVQLQFNLDNFSAPLEITNPYWPMPVGTHIVYEEVAGGECDVDDFVVTDQVKNFGGAYAGLSARVISDRAWQDTNCDGGRGLLLEDTNDWYAQDDAGNIWYFGEDTTAYEYDADGNLTGSSKAGSWESGVDGAVGGLIMLAQPEMGLFYRQEFLAGVAEDQAKIIGVDIPVSIGIGEFTGCIVTKEWSQLEHGAVEHKAFCPNVGFVRSQGYGVETTDSEAVDLGPP